MKGVAGSRGFTLFELLIAIAIFLIISALAYGGLMQVMNARHQIDADETRLAEIQLAFLNLERDVQQVVPRPIRNAYGTEVPAVVGQGDYLLELTHGGLRNPAQVPRSSLQRVAYMVEDDNLERLNWLVLDQAQDSQPVKAVLLKKVTSVDIRFLDPGNNWTNFWPPQTTDTGTSSSTGASAGSLTNMPRAVSVKVELPDIGTIERIFLLPGA